MGSRWRAFFWCVGDEGVDVAWRGMGEAGEEEGKGPPT